RLRAPRSHRALTPLAGRATPARRFSYADLLHDAFGFRRTCVGAAPEDDPEYDSRRFRPYRRSRGLRGNNLVADRPPRTDFDRTRNAEPGHQATEGSAGDGSGVGPCVPCGWLLVDTRDEHDARAAGSRCHRQAARLGGAPTDDAVRLAESRAR